jgi:threonine dehydratase
MQLTHPLLADVYQANQRIRTTVQRTPLIKSSWLSNFTGCEIFLKLECLQITGSFKLRGATSKILALSEDEKKLGVIAVSSGNHGRAVAYVAKKHNLPAVICVSETVPENKISAIKDLGAEVVITGRTYDQATEDAIAIQHERGMTMIHPFDDPLVIAGQGTIGLEILEEEPTIDTVIVPLSGGGLLGGIALTLKSINPQITTIGVSMDQGAAMIESLQVGHVVEIIEQASLADALMGGLGGENKYSFKISQKYVDKTIKVSEQEIAMGMAYALEKEHLVVEGGGAVVLAAILAGKVSDLGQKIALVISGSNVNLPTLLACIQEPYPYQKLSLE